MEKHFDRNAFAFFKGNWAEVNNFKQAVHVSACAALEIANKEPCTEGFLFAF